MPPFFISGKRDRLKSKAKAENKYLFWQLVFIGGMSLEEVEKMSWDTAYEAYEALIMIEEDKKKKK